MLDLIIDNKEWLFSGIGVTVLVFFSVIGKRLYARPSSRHDIRKSQISTDNEGPNHQTFERDSDHILESAGIASLSSIDETYSEHPSVREIHNEINNLPPYQRLGVEKNYTGLKIKWKVSLSIVHPSEEDLVDIVCRSEDYYGVKATVSLAEYPRLKRTKEGEFFWIYGEILGMEPSGFVVQPDRLVF